MQGRPADHSSHLPIPVAMSSGGAEYILVATVYMRAIHLWMLIYDLKYICTAEYDGEKLNQKPTEIIIDNEAAIYMAKCNRTQKETDMLQGTFTI